MLISSQADKDLLELKRLGANDDVIKVITHGESHGELHIDANPAGAEVSIDGEYKGKTPLKIDLSPGSKQLVVGGIEGYGKYEGEVTIEASRTTHRAIQLLRLFSITLTLTPPYADVSLTFLSGNTDEKEYIYIKDGRKSHPLVMKYPAASSGVSKSFTKKVNAPRGGEYNPERLNMMVEVWPFLVKIPDTTIHYDWDLKYATNAE